MELKLNLATASLKDAEHAIFIIGAYFGLTDSTPAGTRVAIPEAVGLPVAQIVGAVVATPAAPAAPAALVDTTGGLPALDPAAAFGAAPVVLPPGAGAAPDTTDPAAVFTAPPGPVGNVAPPVAPTVAAPAGLPAAPAPAPVASAPQVGPGGVEVDNTGLPWDARIHSQSGDGTHPKNADGTWRKKRGVQETYYNDVARQLRAAMAAPAAPAGLPPPPSTPVMPAAPAVAPATPTVLPVAGLMPAPPAAPSAPVGPPAAPTTFPEFMPRITAAINRGILTGPVVMQACQAYQLPNVPALGARADLVPSVWTYLVTQYPQLAEVVA